MSDGENRRDPAGPLVGVRVLEITTTWAGPMCGCLLADFGAEVIKLEHPEGEIARRAPPALPGTHPPLSFLHATVNRNKRSLALDLRDPEAAAIALDLAAGCDLLVENFRPGVLDRLGLGYEAVRRRRPDIIFVSISGYGQEGPDRDRAGYDPLAQAESGFLSLNGSPDGEPVKAPTFLGDDLAGLHAALAALAALHHRTRTGEGQRIDLALLDAMLFQSTGYLTLGAMGVPLPRMGNDFRIAAPARVFACRDGHVMAGVLLDSHWRRLAELLGRPDLARDPRYATAEARLARREEVSRPVAGFCAARTVAEVVEAFRRAGLPAAPVRSYAEAARSEHVRRRGLLATVDHGDGVPVPVVAPPARFSSTPVAVRSPAPALGADDEAILDELGVSEPTRRALRRRGVLGPRQAGTSGRD